MKFEILEFYQEGGFRGLLNFHELYHITVKDEDGKIHKIHIWTIFPNDEYIVLPKIEAKLQKKLPKPPKVILDLKGRIIEVKNDC